MAKYCIWTICVGNGSSIGVDSGSPTKSKMIGCLAVIKVLDEWTLGKWKS